MDAPRIHHQWLPDVVDAEPYAISPDTRKLLQGMGYTVKVETPWGAAEMVEVGRPLRAAGSTASSGNDAALSGGTRPGLLYGANDDRRPAGAALGY